MPPDRAAVRGHFPASSQIVHASFKVCPSIPTGQVVSYERGQDNRSKHHFIISNLLSLSQLNKKNAPRTAGRFSIFGIDDGFRPVKEDLH